MIKQTKLQVALVALGLTGGLAWQSASAVSVFNSPTGTGGAIPDDNAAGLSSSVVVGDDFTILDDFVLTISDFQHTWVGDLIATLEHVDTGTSVTLFNRPGLGGGGGCSSNFGCSTDLLLGDYVFDSDAALDFTAEAIANNSGSMSPGTYNPLGSLDAFNGQSTLGTWTLSISDNAGGDVGGYESWGFQAQVQVQDIPAPATLSIMLPFLGYFGWRQARRRTG